MPVKYFLSKTGSMTRRLAGQPGHGHYDLAVLELAAIGRPPTPESDVYSQMARFGYARVVENGDSNVIWVDAPRALSRAQSDFLAAKRKAGWKVELSNKEFVESRQVSASIVSLLSTT